MTIHRQLLCSRKRKKRSNAYFRRIVSAIATWVGEGSPLGRGASADRFSRWPTDLWGFGPPAAVGGPTDLWAATPDPPPRGGGWALPDRRDEVWCVAATPPPAAAAPAALTHPIHPRATPAVPPPRGRHCRRLPPIRHHRRPAAGGTSALWGSLPDRTGQPPPLPRPSFLLAPERLRSLRRLLSIPREEHQEGTPAAATATHLPHHGCTVLRSPRCLGRPWNLRAWCTERPGCTGSCIFTPPREGCFWALPATEQGRHAGARLPRTPPSPPFPPPPPSVLPHNRKLAAAWHADRLGNQTRSRLWRVPSAASVPAPPLYPGEYRASPPPGAVVVRAAWQATQRLAAEVAVVGRRVGAWQGRCHPPCHRSPPSPPPSPPSRRHPRWGATATPPAGVASPR